MQEPSERSPYLTFLSKRIPECQQNPSRNEAGYFAYCVTAPHLIQKEEETSIKAENAMEEVQKYLDRQAVKKKKKILVVDDSELIPECQQNPSRNESFPIPGVHRRPAFHNPEESDPAGSV